MPVLWEMMEQRKEINRKKYELMLYLMESRKIQGDIREITYRQNSGIDASYGQDQEKKRLKAELSQINAGLKQCYGLSPRMVQHQIDLYVDELEKINKQIENMERSQQDPGRDDGQDR